MNSNFQTNFTNWYETEPNNAGEGEDCVECTNFSKWNDLACTEGRVSICLFDKQNNVLSLTSSSSTTSTSTSPTTTTKSSTVSVRNYSYSTTSRSTTKKKAVTKRAPTTTETVLSIIPDSE